MGEPWATPSLFSWKNLRKIVGDLYLSITVFQSFLHELANISVGREHGKGNLSRRIIGGIIAMKGVPASQRGPKSDFLLLWTSQGKCKGSSTFNVFNGIYNTCSAVENIPLLSIVI